MARHVARHEVRHVVRHAGQAACDPRAARGIKLSVPPPYDLHRQHVTHARHGARAAGDGVGLRLVAVRRRHAAARRPLRPALAPAGSRLAGGGGVPGGRRRRRGPPPPPPSPAPRYAFSPFPLHPPPYSPTAARPVEHLQVCAE
jgi:hypothetical protein